MSIEHYTYELRKSRMGKYLGSKVAIREDWVKRTRRYVVASGLDLNALATFVKKGLYDRRLEGFNEKALEEPLTSAQQWTLMWIILSDFGVPEWLRDESADENVPEMAVAEPDEEESGVVSALVKPAVAVGGGAATIGATVGTAAADATVEAGKTTLSAGKAVGEAALSVAAIPVKTLSSLVTGSVKEEAEEAIAEAEEAIAEAEAPEAEVPEAEVPEGEEAPEEVTEDAGDDQSGE